MHTAIKTRHHLYRFAVNSVEGDSATAKDLGGKGAAVQEMSRLGICVPPGFTISTDVCRAFLRDGRLPGWFDEELSSSLCWLERLQGKAFGGEENPLLVSVRSGAAVSMPGMMDTILNVGLNDVNVRALAERPGGWRFALDSYRRLLQMFGTIALGIPKMTFDSIVRQMSGQQQKSSTADFDEGALEQLVAKFKAVIHEYTGESFPADCRRQLDLAIVAVFRSWNNERAQHYRLINHLDEQAGTAVTIQAMVFGNSGKDSGTGVGFSRNPSTGERVIFGEFLPNAQGEDIVAGTHTPMALSELGRTMPWVYDQLRVVVDKLEAHYGDAQDFEFTVDRGQLFLLQTRNAKRSAAAAVRVAVEMADEGLISVSEAICRIDPLMVNHVISPQLDLSHGTQQLLGRGLAASPGSAVGQVVFSPVRAVSLAGQGKEHPVILVREETSADDIHGLEAAVGFVTARGGATSHAAVVARGMGKCCITGATGLKIQEAAGVMLAEGFEVREGDWISIDGSTGQIFAGRLPLTSAHTDNPWIERLLTWCRETIGPSVHANADTPEDALRARTYGASGIGLCRSEHMFFTPERLGHVRAMILAGDQAARKIALDRLLPIQEGDFRKIFRAMAGLPVTIRLIDPPLHEFLPTPDEIEAAITTASTEEDAAELNKIMSRVRQLKEVNPMMGHRGCRLGITYPEIISMQTHAILGAALAVRAEGIQVAPEIMIPLVSSVEEVRFLRKVMGTVASEIFIGEQQPIHYKLGTMIELPRAAMCAAEIALEVDFFSFGTNDLTQMTFGFSRDDARKYLDTYLELSILKDDPFSTIDREGVGQLMQLAILNARQANPSIQIGVCGEHAGDPKSIEFFDAIGVDYLSVSPARIPIAQLALAQARLKSVPIPSNLPTPIAYKNLAAGEKMLA
jgi:pyruvate, orthophosphate dikinase